MWLGKRGLVTKINKDCCIVVTNEGIYEKVPVTLEEVQVGAEITYRSPIAKRTIKILLLAASFMVLFLSYNLFHQASLKNAMAVVSLDINPSLEMSVNKDLNVIAVKCFNDDAANLLKEENIEGKNLYDALTAIVKKAIELNYIKNDQENLIISTVTSSEADEGYINQEKIRQSLENTVASDGLSGKVQIYSVTDEFRSAAENKGLSPGQFLIYEQLKKMGNQTSIDEVQKNNINKLVETYKIELLPNFEKITVRKNTGSNEDPEISIKGNLNTHPVSFSWNTNGQRNKDGQRQRKEDGGNNKDKQEKQNNFSRKKTNDKESNDKEYGKKSEQNKSNKSNKSDKSDKSTGVSTLASRASGTMNDKEYGKKSEQNKSTGVSTLASRASGTMKKKSKSADARSKTKEGGTSNQRFVQANFWSKAGR